MWQSRQVRNGDVMNNTVVMATVTAAATQDTV